MKDKGYYCPCGLPLSSRRVVHMERYKQPSAPLFGQPRQVLIEFNCSCTEDPQKRVYDIRTEAVRALQWGGFHLPYDNPFQPTLSLVEIEKEVAQWRFDLSHIDTVDEFLWWLEAYAPRPKPWERHTPSSED